MNQVLSDLFTSVTFDVAGGVIPYVTSSIFLAAHNIAYNVALVTPDLIYFYVVYSEIRL